MSWHWDSKDMDANVYMSYMTLDLIPLERQEMEKGQTHRHKCRKAGAQWVVPTLIT